VKIDYSIKTSREKFLEKVEKALNFLPENSSPALKAAIFVRKNEKPS
jgi:hypothetical protein